METEEITFFYCYSPRLRRLIHESGIKWIDKGINPNSGYPYWKYEDNDELGEVLKAYREL